MICAASLLQSISLVQNSFFSSCPSSLEQNIESWIESVARSLAAMFCSDSGLDVSKQRKHQTCVTSKERHFRHHCHAFVMINLSCFVVIRALSRQSLNIAYV